MWNKMEDLDNRIGGTRRPNKMIVLGQWNSGLGEQDG